MSIQTTNPTADVTDRSARQLGEVSLTDSYQDEYLPLILNEVKRTALIVEQIHDNLDLPFYSGVLYLNRTPDKLAAKGVVNLGDGGFYGTGVSFVGSTAGTYLAVNALSTFTGNTVDIQVAGVSFLKVAGTTTASPNYGLLSLGTAPFDGVTTGFFNGPSAGSIIAMNVASSFTGDFIHFKQFDNFKFSVSSSGTVFTSAGFNCKSDPNASTTAINNVSGGGSSFSGSSGGTIYGCNTLNTFAGNLLDLQVNTVSKFSVNYQGNVVVIGTKNVLTSAPDAVSTYGLLNLGSAPFDGVSSGFFNGTSGGTVIAINSPIAFTGNFLDFHFNGFPRFTVGSDGTVSSFGGYGVWTKTADISALSAVISLGDGGYGGSAGTFSGNSQGTYVAINTTSSFLGSLIDVQVNGVSKFSVNYQGNVVLAGTLPAASLSGTIAAASLTNAKSRMQVFIPVFGIRNGPVFDGLLLGSFPLTAVGSCRKALTGGTAFTDLTSAANNATTSDVTFNFGATNDAFYIGHATLKFTTIKIKYTTASVYSATLVWEYWNGSTWGTLLTTTPTFLADSTATFPATNSLKAAAGSYFITFQPPSDWASTTVNAVAGFYVRLRVSAFTSLTTGIAADQIWLYTVTSGSGISAGQHGNITRIDWNASTLSVGANDSKFLIINGTTGSMYLFTATKGAQNVADTTINLAVSETDQILVQQIQNSAAAFVESGGFQNVNLAMTITPT